MIGGMSWESSALYYQLINRETHRRLGGQHNARSLLFTLDFDELDVAAAEGDWPLIAARVADAARRLEQAGAEFIIITSVTAHRVFDDVQASVGVPLLHVADAVKGKLHEGQRIGLLGTKFTLNMPHLIGPLRERHRLNILTPSQTEQDRLQGIISNELQRGQILATSQQSVRLMAAALGAAGAEAIILGCTELPLLMSTEQYPLPTLDLVRLHVDAALDLALVHEG